MYSQNAFRKIGKILTARSVLTNAERYAPETHRLLDAETIKPGTSMGAAETARTHVRVDLDNNYNEFLEVMTHVTGADADTNVVAVYASRGSNDDYMFVASLATVTGTHVVRGGGATKLYNDAAVVTEKNTGFEVVTATVEANGIATTWINRNGYKNWLFIASTLNSTDLSVEIAGVDRRNIPSV